MLYLFGAKNLHSTICIYEVNAVKSVSIWTVSQFFMSFPLYDRTMHFDPNSQDMIEVQTFSFIYSVIIGESLNFDFITPTLTLLKRLKNDF